MTTKLNKYTTYGSINFGDNAKVALTMLENVLDGSVKIQFPFTIEYCERFIKVRNRDELIVFYNAVKCTVEAVSPLKKESDKNNFIKCDMTDTYRRTRGSYEPPFGIVNSDVFYVG
jgi:hypothetical protein